MEIAKRGNEGEGERRGGKVIIMAYTTHIWNPRWAMTTGKGGREGEYIM